MKRKKQRKMGKGKEEREKDRKIGGKGSNRGKGQAIKLI